MLVSDIEAAKVIDVTTGTLRQWRYIGSGPPFYKMPTGGVRYDIDEVLAWAKSGATVYKTEKE